MALDIQPFEHVVDSKPGHFEFFHTIGWDFHLSPEWLSKFMLLEVVAAIIILLMYIPLARKVRTGAPPRGRWANACESLLTFIRDQVARPAIGEHDYVRYLPLLWTMFLFVLFCNLLGMIPFLASPTASIMVTGTLALIVFLTIHISGLKENGLTGYLKSFIPHIEMNDPVMKIIGPPIVVGLFFLELMSAVIRGFVLAVRLFANMLAGHTVLFVLLLFIKLLGEAAHYDHSTAANILFWPITFASVIMVTLLSVLELFVGLLQAYVFTFLTAIFLGMALHPEH